MRYVSVGERTKMHLKNLAKWTRTVPIPNKDNIMSSHARAHNEKGFTPSYEKEGRPNFYYLINQEYRRIWFKERGQYEKEVYTKKEMMKEESKIKRRFVQRMMVPKKKEKPLPIIKLKRKVTEELVKNFIVEDNLVIFSKTYCPYCKQAKEILNNLDKPYTSIELDTRKDAEDIQKVLEKMTGARTLPRIFFKGQCLGGASDLQALRDNGKLKEMIK